MKPQNLPFCVVAKVNKPGDKLEGGNYEIEM